MNTKEALEYLRRIHPTIHISADTFYHTLHRMKKRGQIEKVLVQSKEEQRCVRRGIPFTGTPLYRYSFTEEQLQAMRFRNPRIDKKTLPKVTATNVDELVELEDKYGKLVDEAGLILALEEKFGVRYDRNAINARRMRGTLIAPVQIGSTWLYPVEQIESANFSPERVLDKKTQELVL